VRHIYIIWDTPRDTVIEGAPSRYFLPLFPILALALPALPARFHTIQWRVGQVAVVYLASVNLLL
jgi:hypothetical protein